VRQADRQTDISYQTVVIVVANRTATEWVTKTTMSSALNAIWGIFSCSALHLSWCQPICLQNSRNALISSAFCDSHTHRHSDHWLSTTRHQIGSRSGDVLPSQSLGLILKTHSCAVGSYPNVKYVKICYNSLKISSCDVIARLLFSVPVVLLSLPSFSLRLSSVTTAAQASAAGGQK